MIIDSRVLSKQPFEQQLSSRRRVFVDGVEIYWCWYVDTIAGYVRTFDVLGDSLRHSVADLERMGKMESDFDDIEGCASKTLMGTVVLKGYDEQ